MYNRHSGEYSAIDSDVRILSSQAAKKPAPNFKVYKSRKQLLVSTMTAIIVVGMYEQVAVIIMAVLTG